MTVRGDKPPFRLPHYRAWLEAWRHTEPSQLPPRECLAFLVKEGPQWLQQVNPTMPAQPDLAQHLVACFKAASNARLILLGGKVAPSCDEVDVLSASYDPRVECDCTGLVPTYETMSRKQLKSCGCKAIERMMAVGELASSKEDEWNKTSFFSSNGLSEAMEELALCHADTQPPPLSCHGKTDWPEVQAPDRKPNPDMDLDDETYHSLFPTNERIRLSADAKHFFAVASGASLIDSGIQMALADSGNDILIGDYCDAASDERLEALQQEGAAGFAFLKLCVYAGIMTDWHFDHLVAQIIQFRVLSYWRDHALSRRPGGAYGSRMTGMGVHRHIDLGMVIGIVSASLATGETITGAEYTDLVNTTVIINDLLDFRGDTWRKQRENVVLKGVRGCLCTYLDGLICECIEGATALIRRGDVFALVVMTFCNWMLMSSGHKLFEIVHGTRPVIGSEPCHYKSSDDGSYERLQTALAKYGSLGDAGPSIALTRKELQLRYVKYRSSSETHVKWVADAVRVALHPETLRRLADVVHFQWTGDLGHVGYCS